MVAGKRQQISFATKGEAEAEMARRRGELRRVGEVGVMLTDGERLRFARARDELAAMGGTIEEAVAFWRSHHGGAVVRCTLEEMVARCVEAKWEEGRSAKHRAQMKSVGMALVKSVGRRDACDVTREDVERWLTSNQYAAVTWNSYMVVARAMFGWAKKERMVRVNPCEGITRRRVVAEEVRYLRPRECERLLRAAMDARHVACLPFVVLGLFCGLRPDRELGLMQWEDVRLSEAVVIVSSGRAKTRQRRVVDLSENAVAWLRWFAEQGGGTMTGRVVPPNHRRRWKALRVAAGLLNDWTHDAMRHTFASMHLAFHGDEKRLQLLMGHTSAQMIYQHYRGVVTRVEAAEFWQLQP